MDWFTALGTAIGAGAVMAVVQILRDLRDGKSIFKKNGAAESQGTVKKILEGQDKLSLHFNHETTDRLDRIANGIDRLLNAMTAANTKLDILLQNRNSS